MVDCEQGYLCDVCGGDVENLVDSELYLRYVIGLVDPETLHTTRERHIRCNPALGQFIVDGDFTPIVIDGTLDKRQLDPAFVRQQEALVTRGYRRLKELAGLDLPILDYPLPEVRAKLAQHQPTTLAQAGQIDGMTPAALMLVLAQLRKGGRRVSAVV